MLARRSREARVAEGWVAYLLLFASGVVAGALNVLAGGGSFLTLPVLILLGLPATAANGTNRIGVITQNVGAVWAFRRHGVLQARWTLRYALLPSVAGSVLGTWAALEIPDAAFRKLLAVLMLVVTVWTLWDPIRPPTSDRPREGSTALAVGFFVAGVYGGFVQAGVGFILLALTSLAGFDLVRGNAIKVLCILVFTVLSVALFAWRGELRWGVGLLLAVGTTIGGLIGAHLTVLKGHRWLRGVVTVAVVVLAVRLWWTA